MPDNVTLPGTGSVVEAVEVGGALRQVVQVANLPDTQPVSATALPLPTGAATEVTAAALLAAAQAIKTAAETLAGRTINTGAVSGTVALDGPTLAALEAISADTGLAQPLTDAQLRSAPVPVTAPANLPTSKNATIFQYSTQNTSAVQLAAGATFTGVIETALDQPSISVLLTSDQPTTLTVRQFIDAGGTRAVPDIVFYVDANLGFSRSFTLNGNYVQVLAQNTGASTTTTFSLNTAYGDLGNSESGGIMPVTELPLILVGAAAQTATVNNILTPVSGAAPVNVGGFRSASVQVTSTATGGAYIFEQSNDGVNWVALPVFNAALVTAVPITAAITPTASAIIYTIPLRCTFFRLRISTTLTGGSIRAYTRISTEPWTATAQLVGNNTAANLQVTATVSGTATTTPATPTPSNVNSAATTNATVVKGSAGTLYNIGASNTGAAAAFIKLYNKATAPTVGTDVPVLTLVVPASGNVDFDLGPMGHRFATGIGLAITNLAADSDTTAVAANQVKVLTSFI